MLGVLFWQYGITTTNLKKALKEANRKKMCVLLAIVSPKHVWLSLVHGLFVSINMTNVSQYWVEVYF